MLSRPVLPLSRLRLAQVAPRAATATARSAAILHHPRFYARSRDYYLGDQGDYKLPSSAQKPRWQQTSSFASKPPKQPLRPVPGDESELKFPQSPPPSSPHSHSQDSGPSTSRSSQHSSPHGRPTGSTPSAKPDEHSSVSEDADADGPAHPLPDLTRGIPSTLDAELQQAQSRGHASRSSLNITEDPSEPIAPEEEGPGGRGPRETYVSSSDRKKNAAYRYTYLFLGLFVVGYSAYLGRNWETEGEEKKYSNAPSGWGFGLFYDRVKARLSSTMSYYNDPVTTKLLPDEDPDPAFRMPFTLVLSLEDMLVHQEWSRDKGWRIAKRPGLDYFLRYLSQYYELVLFTSQPSAMGDQVMRKLDPYLMVRWPLYREATLYKDGGYIKDLSYLNRDLKKVIILDTVPHHVKNQPENAIILPKWKGDPKDQTLVQLIPFLEYLATMGFEDARTVLKSFEGKFIPAEFARREKLLREKFETQQSSKGKKKKSLGVSSWFKQQSPDGLPSLDEAEAQGKMLWDVIRERGQRQYMELEKKIKEEGDKFLAEREAEEKKMQEEAMNNMKKGWFGFGKSAGSGIAESKPSTA